MQDQDCLIWIFLGWNSKMPLDCGILHQHPQIFLNAKFQTKIKILKFGTKTALIGYFRLEFQKLMSYLKSVSSIIQKQGNFKLGSQNTLFRYFWAAIY